MSLFSCRGDMVSREAMLNNYKKIYNLSISYHDYGTAENAVYQELALDLDTTKTLSYKDTLFNLYYNSGQFVQAVTLGKEIITKQPYNLIEMEMLGDAEKNINNFEDALGYYQTIYSKLHDLFHLYKIALLQFNLSRMSECNQTLDQIIADTGSVNQKIQIIIGGQGETQNVPYKAAAYNIRGAIAKGLKQTEVAKQAFNDALAVYPDFALAKSNLEELNK